MRRLTEKNDKDFFKYDLDITKFAEAVDKLGRIEDLLETYKIKDINDLHVILHKRIRRG